jgi:hypothetical protein
LESQRVPSLALPALGDAVSFKNDVLSSELAKVITHGEPGLPAADDHRFDLFHGDLTIEILIRRPAIRP